MCLFLAAKLNASSVPKGTAPDLQWSDALCGLAVSGGPASYTFNYSATPFSFAISRSGSNTEPIFNTAGTRLMFKVLWPDKVAMFCLQTCLSSLRLAAGGLVVVSPHHPAHSKAHLGLQQEVLHS